MSTSRHRSSYVFVLCASAVALLFVASSARAFELEPVLSLTGTCTTDSVDPVPDPGCPGGVHPASGRFKEPKGVAIDPYGNEYVPSIGGGASSWIDVFDDEGNFITELTGVDSPATIAVDSKGNLYVFNGVTGTVRRYAPAAGSEPEVGKIEYKDPPVTVSAGSFNGVLAVDATNDQLLVARAGKITRYKSAAEGNGELAASVDIGSFSLAMAVDAQRRRLYVSNCPGSKTSECQVEVLNADTFAPLETIDGSTTPAEKFTAFFGHLPIAVDEATGEFCIGDIELAKTVYCFDEDFNFISATTNANFSSNSMIQIAISNGKRPLAAEPCEIPTPKVPAGDACNRHFLFVPVNSAGEAGGNRVLAFQPPEVGPPVIKSVSVGGISETEAELKASIRPHGADTEYTIEYLTQQKFEEQGEQFTGATVAGEGTIAGTTFEAAVSAQVGGLDPGTAYRFRVVANNVIGEDEEEGSFATYSDATPVVPCPNEALRTGPSAALPDCRAYELVTPPNTNGREPLGLSALGDTFTTVQASPDGNAATFRIEGGSLPGTTGTGGFNGDPYLSTRTSGGWTTTLAGPSGAEATVTIPGANSADQGYSFWSGREEGSAVIEDLETRYVRYPDGHSELIGRGSLGTDPTAKGMRIAEGGTHIVFETKNIFPAVAQQLEPDAPPTGTGAVYDRTADEVTHVVSLLPEDVTPAAGENAKYVGASPDGEGIAFEVGGNLYLRKNNATTYELPAGVEFAGISDGGERVFYLKGGDLLAYDTSEDKTIEFSNTHNVTPVNVATSGNRAAFVSPSVLGGANPEGEVAQLGEQNLYLSTGGQVAFVATVTDRDVEGDQLEGNQVDGLGLWTEVALGGAAILAETQAASDPSRLNPSGSVLLFQSRAELTGYDPDGSAEVYRYDSAAGRLHCLSCIPTGAAATGGGALQSYTFNSSLGGAPLSPVTLVPNLSPDGSRVFFESTEALVSGDSDGLRDVYEWEEQGLGGCDRAGGCTYLISSGHSGRANFLYGQSQSGDDVFFTTGDLLNGFDGGGTVSIYDAKVNGGFAEPVPPDCVAEGCRPGLTASPSLPPPESGARPESGNLPPHKPKHCPKGKHKVKQNGKVRCVAKHKPKKKKGGTNGRAGK